MGLFSTPQGAIRAVLLSQVLMGGAIVALDLRGTPGTPAPGLFAPPAQGPAVRPYRPDLRAPEPGAPAMRPMPEALEFAAEGDAIRIAGQIAPGDADRFATWLDRNRPSGTRVSLDSSGGSVGDALAIGRTIRAAGYDTEVADGAVCLSACPYILAGGTNRQVAPTGVVGVHQHDFGKNTILPAFMAIRDVQRGQAGVMDYLADMGVDLRLMSYALRTPPEEINILTPDVMADLGLVSG
ncbi:hypothetical protein GIY56_10840 [Paracoccus sp. YIM 132242]|uniref:Periplasmic protein-like protein n=1 Tax=Paracoccus lichenicola TaxID=2665644 RepID=A0A6L6HTX4_9RHOB|nr:hypothetical protein [Paracoccus lichenicola]